MCVCARACVRAMLCVCPRARARARVRGCLCVCVTPCVLVVCVRIRAFSRAAPVERESNKVGALSKETGKFPHAQIETFRILAYEGIAKYGSRWRSMLRTNRSVSLSGRFSDTNGLPNPSVSRQYHFKTDGLVISLQYGQFSSVLTVQWYGRIRQGAPRRAGATSHGWDAVAHSRWATEQAVYERITN